MQDCASTAAVVERLGTLQDELLQVSMWDGAFKVGSMARLAVHDMQCLSQLECHCQGRSPQDITWAALCCSTGCREGLLHAPGFEVHAEILAGHCSC